MCKLRECWLQPREMSQDCVHLPGLRDIWEVVLSIFFFK